LRKQEYSPNFGQRRVVQATKELDNGASKETENGCEKGQRKHQRGKISYNITRTRKHVDSKARRSCLAYIYGMYMIVKGFLFLSVLVVIVVGCWVFS
jgi:hypothetical protein